MENQIEVKIVTAVLEALGVKRAEGAITEETIKQYIDIQCMMYPPPADQETKNRMAVKIKDNISTWIGEAQELVNNEDHEPWLNNRKSEIHWGYWDRYRRYLLPKLGLDPVERLDDIADKILSHIEDPKREGPWDRRGLVVGHVQSGKTSNYTGLICKAADAGYKIIIVLAGLHKNLRSQTQIRLEEGFLGYNTKRRKNRGLEAIGVGLDPPPLPRPESVTNREDDGDFVSSKANAAAVNVGDRPLVFVIKKQKTVLENLINWVRWADEITGTPLLMIDDEADHASVNTRDGAFDENGNPDPEHDPSTINGLIRKLLKLFQQKAFIGYTATPFANIFIHEQAETKAAGPDLFPSSFIVNLPAPSNYFGPAHVFGTNNDEGDNYKSNSHRYVREIRDHANSLDLDETEGWVPPKHKNYHEVLYEGEAKIPPSLRKAVHSFVIATAIRRFRGQLGEHNSMLVHVSRFTSVQSDVKLQIEAEVNALRRELRYGELDESRSALEDLKELFLSDFKSSLLDSLNPHGSSLSWSDLLADVLHTVQILKIKEINGTAGDILDYENERGSGLTVIAIGGDKLSRGLTLEGLTVSYFLRASRMYDTLMQMGRWFGYRQGYTDVCRIFMTKDLREWFENITVAAEELRQEFDHMAAVGGSPRNYGLRVRSHPTLLVTSNVKMRNGTPIKLSFAGTISETIVFSRSQQVIEDNFAAVERLVLKLGSPSETNPKRDWSATKSNSWRNTHLWNDVKASDVVSFLASYQTHEESKRANSDLLRQYIEKQMNVGDLQRWHVALFSGQGSPTMISDLSVNLVQRKPLEKNLDIQEQIRAEKYVIGRLVSPRDETIDLTNEEYAAALDLAQKSWKRDYARNLNRRDRPPTEPTGPAIREIRNAGRGLLMLYPIDPENGVTDPAGPPVLGVAISFPTSETASEVDYVVNNVFVQSDTEI